MKTIHRIAIICAGLLIAASCGEKPEPQPVNPHVRQHVDPVSLELTFVLPDDAGKTKWVPGDQIVVHGEYADEQVTVTLITNNIYSDGKTAKVMVHDIRPYKVEGRNSTLYAAWPADAVSNSPHCLCYTGFSNTNKELLAACNDEENVFRFQPVTGALSFTLNSDYDSYTIVANRKEPLGYGYMQVMLTDEENEENNVNNFNQFASDPILTFDLPVVNGVNTIYLPAGTEFANGVLMKFRKDGAFVKQLRITDPIEITRAQTKDLGNIASSLVIYDDPFSSSIKDLDTKGNANCYIVTEPGTFKFKAVKGNSPTSFVVGAESAVVLWETWNNTAEVTANSVVQSVSYAEDYMIFHTPDVLKPGNAVIAAVDVDGNVLWSWHIWVPASPITESEYGGIFGKSLMDRNLGALVPAKAGNSPVDPLSYGFVYQWGRKDPFTAAGEFNSSNKATIAGEAEVVAEATISLEESIAHPRLLGHTNNSDWVTPSDGSLWSNGSKTIYDPCPPGYRVPPRDTSKPFWSSDDSAQAGWAIDGTNGWITIGNPVAVFPIAGYRDDYSVGGIDKVGKRTLYWTSEASNAEKGCGADLRFDKGTYAGSGSAPKARLASVRCVAE